VFTRPHAVTKYGVTNLPISFNPAGTIGALVGTIGAQAGTIASQAATFGLQTIIHGTHNGYVVNQDHNLSTVVDLATGNSTNPAWKYTTKATSFGKPRTLKVVREIAVEHIKSSENNFSARVFGNAGELSETQTFNNAVGNIGDCRTLTRGFRYAAPTVAIELTGTTPVKLLSFEVDLIDTDSRKRNP
jgi:hypothetical protein